MAETTADVRRDIEVTRERMSGTIEELEQKLNVKQLVRDHPWPALAIAVGAGVMLSGSRADVKAAAATSAATKGARSKLGTALDDIIAQLVTAATDALQHQVDSVVTDVRSMLGASQSAGAPTQPRVTQPRQTVGYGVGPIDEPMAERPTSIPRGD
jgi:ElaB/YqjD/DUF883 family membrane-anchored ribosome-binding protein